MVPFDPEGLKKLIKGRSVSRRYVKKIVAETAKIVAEKDIDKLKTNREILRQESESLKKRDQEILDLIDDEKFEDEMLECKEYVRFYDIRMVALWQFIVAIDSLGKRL